jgi:hypothetical protein
MGGSKVPTTSDPTKANVKRGASTFEAADSHRANHDVISALLFNDSAPIGPRPERSLAFARYSEFVQRAMAGPGPTRASSDTYSSQRPFVFGAIQKRQGWPFRLSLKTGSQRAPSLDSPRGPSPPPPSINMDLGSHDNMAHEQGVRSLSPETDHIACNRHHDSETTTTAEVEEGPPHTRQMGSLIEKLQLNMVLTNNGSVARDHLAGERTFLA